MPNSRKWDATRLSKMTDDELRARRAEAVERETWPFNQTTWRKERLAAERELKKRGILDAA